MTYRTRLSAILLVVSFLVLVACGSDPAGQGGGGDATSLDADAAGDIDAGGVPDALDDGSDTAPTPDAGVDTDEDVDPRDVSVDAPIDTPTPDAGVDTSPDAPDATADVTPDALADTARDAAPDTARICVPGTSECRDGIAATCSADGTRWNTTACVGDTVCVAGTCVPAVCEPGTVLCAPGAIVACNDGGDGFVETPCPEAWACFDGACVECVRDGDCGDPTVSVCRDGLCVPAPVEIVTDELPAFMIGEPVEFEFEAAGGTLPYAWSTAGGAWPDGLSLAEDGALTGTPAAVSEGEVTVAVGDAGDDGQTRAFTWRVLPEGLRIVTESLPRGEEGFEYEATLEAIGGERPYGWMILEGALPSGITLGSDGLISGVPSDVGDFPVTVRVFDRATPPGFSDRELVMSVEIAPLRIVAETQYDLLVTSVIVLPLMVPIEGIPVPYNQQLEARGGLRPYTWRETELAGALSFLIPNAGVPDGLTLGEDGSLTGSVTDTSQVVRVAIPFTSIELTGFFFTAEVADSQDPAETASGIFLIPTVPIGG